MSETHFVVNKSPSEWSKERDVCHGIVTDAPWKRNHIRIGEINVIGRNLWRASDPLWANEVVYYNTSHKSLFNTLDRIVVHHTNNSDSISENEKKQKATVCPGDHLAKQVKALRSRMKMTGP